MTARATAGLSLGTHVAKERAAVRRALRDGTLSLADLIAGDASEVTELQALPMTLSALFTSARFHHGERAMDLAGVTTLEHPLGLLPIAARRRVADLIRRTTT